MGVLVFSDGARYVAFLIDSNVILIRLDGFRYEGTFSEGWFHGPGAFWRSDGMRYEGEFRGGRIWGQGK